VSGEQKSKRFALGQEKAVFAPADLAGAKDFKSIKAEREKIRDQDNAAPTPKPKMFSLDNPRLAPSGMKGITRSVTAGRDVNINVNVTVRVDQASHAPRKARVQEPPKEQTRIGDQGKARKKFKPLSQNEAIKTRGRWEIL